ncbi:uncharacterized protein LOC116257258 isoform X2 [Nymphaea colorata]|uniref:uncharacterized protein LOC116257258 isoform X2 n=1 Tax=Nymphaea colorata TaxID=210225 RepID=UPI00214E8695|nr:uncharacterized protein LOC116257258 isoform X2 [Nymphaea colorata]
MSSGFDWTGSNFHPCPGSSFTVFTFQVIAPFPLFTKDTTPVRKQRDGGKGRTRRRDDEGEGDGGDSFHSSAAVWFDLGPFHSAPALQIACERECSRGEDYRLIKLTISDYVTQREKNVIVECRGHDAARFCNVEHAHGWDNDVIRTLEKVEKKDKISVSFECETLKSDKAAEDHIRQFMPKLVGLGAVG